MPRSLLALALFAALLVSCTDTPDAADPDVPATTDVLEDGSQDRLAVHTRDGNIKLALTDETVYFWLSDTTMQRIEEEVARETEGLGSFAEDVADFVQKEVTKVVRDEMQFRIDEIRDIRYENGRLQFDFVDPGYELPNISQEGEPVTGRFPPDEARRFVEAFRQAKANR